MPANETIHDKLLFITDLHFWQLVFDPMHLFGKPFLGQMNVFFKRRHHFIHDRAADFAEALAKTQVRTLLIGGDLTSTSSNAEFARAVEFVKDLAKRGLNVAVIPGNHDVYTYRTHARKRFEQHMGAWFPKALPTRTLLPGGTPLVLVPTVTPTRLSARGYITDEEVAETRKLIEGCPPGPIIVAGHYPVLHKTYGYTSNSSRQLRNAPALHKALGEPGRQLIYLAGHVHQFSHVVDPKYPHVQHCTTAAFFQRRDEQEGRLHGAFTEIEVVDDALRVIAWKSIANKWAREELPARG